MEIVQIVNVKQIQQESIIHDITFGLRLALQDRFLFSLGKLAIALLRAFCNSLDMIQMNLILFLYIQKSTQVYRTLYSVHLNNYQSKMHLKGRQAYCWSLDAIPFLSVNLQIFF